MFPSLKIAVSVDSSCLSTMACCTLMNCLYLFSHTEIEMDLDKSSKCLKGTDSEAYFKCSNAVFKVVMYKFLLIILYH